MNRCPSLIYVIFKNVCQGWGLNRNKIAQSMTNCGEGILLAADLRNRNIFIQTLVYCHHKAFATGCQYLKFVQYVLDELEALKDNYCALYFLDKHIFTFMNFL